MKRIFIDCSHIRLDMLPTGIPRVVANYIEWGQRWATTHDVEVQAVIPYRGGLLPAALFAIRDPSRASVQLPQASATARRMRAVRLLYEMAITRLELLTLHGLTAAGLLVPIRFRYTERFALRSSVLVRKVLDVGTALLDKIFVRLAGVKFSPGDILFSPAYWHDVDADIYDSLHRHGLQLNLLVHDLLPITVPQYYPHPWRDDFRQRLQDSFKTITRYYCVSDQTRRDLLAFAASTGVRNLQVRTAHNGLDPLSEPTPVTSSRPVGDLTEAGRPFLLMVGSIEPKKNHIYVLDQLSRLWQDGYDLPLVIVGRRGWMEQRVVQRIRSHPEFNKRLFWLDRVSDGELVTLYRGAQFLLFASEAEGFGLPIIEALSNRLPCILFDTPIAREVAGDFGIYFDRKSTHLNDVLLASSAPDAYARTREALGAYAWPGWQEQVEAVFEDLLRAVDDTVMVPVPPPARPGLSCLTPDMASRPA